MLAPVSHWVRGGGWIYQAIGAVDHGGGLSVLVPVGISALVFAAILGRPRTDVVSEGLPFSSAVALAGSCLFWLKIGPFNDTELGFPLVDEQYAIVTHQKVW